MARCRCPSMTLLTLVCSGLLACGRESPAQPEVAADAVIVLTIASIQEMPFHGPGGPGTEPMSITFRWTVVLTTPGGPGAMVRAIRTELRESNSETPIVAPDPGPLDRTLRAGVPLELPLSAAGLFNSALYPGRWEGRVSVDIVHLSGRQETLQTTFSFR